MASPLRASSDRSPRKIAIMGSTGSIGKQAIDVVKGSEGRFQVVAMSAYSDWKTLAAQAYELHPELVVIGDRDAASYLEQELPQGTSMEVGASGLVDAVMAGDVVLNAVVGFAGLQITITAIQEGKRLALANKESLVAGGDLVSSILSRGIGEIIPVDSEHCAIQQCMRASVGADEVSRLIITSSGGPFRGFTSEQLSGVTVAQALNHPNWVMGSKITVDSSTLMNKGLEVIEAHVLFGMDYDRIEVVIHPQSIVHSMVEFVDGATMAQMSNPDMRLPIGYALGYPERMPVAYGKLDWRVLSRLDFDLPDRESFRCLAIAEEAGRLGRSYPVWLNAANEVAVELFLQGALPWRSIADVVGGAVESCEGRKMNTVEEVEYEDELARQEARRIVNRLAS